MTLSDLRARVAYWQKRMGLMDWKLEVLWGNDEIDEGSLAEILVTHLFERHATIHFKKPKRGTNVDDVVICHELSHIYFAPFYINANDLNEERACCSISHAIVGK